MAAVGAVCQEAELSRGSDGARGHVNGSSERSVFHVPARIGPLALKLKLKLKRMRCPRCGRCWSDVSEIVSDISPHVTSDLAGAMAFDLMDRRAVTEATAKYGISPHVATKAPDRAPADEAYLPRRLAPVNSGRAPSTGSSAGQSPTARWACLRGAARQEAEDPGGRTSRGTGAGRECVRWLCCDTYGPFFAAAKRWLPNATACVDRFHVVWTVTKAVSDVRKQVQGRKDLDAAAKEVRKS